jgi:hypothetical protein
MSQHNFQTVYKNRPVNVLMGWDRPLAGFFLVIEYSDNQDKEEYAYVNLDDEEIAAWDGLPPDTNRFTSVLASMGIRVPQLMLDEIQKDAENNVGNRYVCYDAEGNIQ